MNQDKDQIFYEKMLNIQRSILDFIETENELEESYQIFADSVESYHIRNSTQETKIVLMMILKIADNHQRKTNFFQKIEKILLYFQNEIKKYFSNSEIFDLFKGNKRILLFFFLNEILVIDRNICKSLMTEKFIMAKYPQYFSPEIKPFMNEDWFLKDCLCDGWLSENNEQLPEIFYTNRKRGENESYICKLIQKDMINDFMALVNSNDISYDEKINLSIFETNSFLIKSSFSNELSLLNYSAFYGSCQIFNFLITKYTDFSPSIWLYAIHGNSLDLIHLLEKKAPLPEDSSYKECLIESIKCHHNEISNYIQRTYFKKKVASLGLKYYNFSFIDDKKNIELKVLDLLDVSEMFNGELHNQEKTKKRGRPPKPKNIEEIDAKNTKRKKKEKVDNNKKVQQLENPHLRSIESRKPFIIAVPNSKHDLNAINSQYELKTYESIDLKIFDIEKKFNGDEDQASSDDDEVEEIKSKIEDEEELNLNNVTLDNLESNFSPFPDPFTVLTFITKANKGYYLRQIDTNDPNLLSFKCKASGCFFHVVFSKKEDGFHVTHLTYHTCLKPIIIETSELRKVIKTQGKVDHLDKNYMQKINEAFGLPSNYICKNRIRRAYNKVFDLSRFERINAWGMLDSFIAVIKSGGGNGLIHKTKEGYIDFVGMVPNYSIYFMHSSLFFPVVQCDTRFQTGISRGRLYSIVTLTGNRTILPLAVGWAPSEAKQYTEMLLSMISNEVSLIKTCHTDDSKALIVCIEKVGISNSLCSWHIGKHCPNKKAFMTLVKSQNSREYATNKNKIIENKKKLKKYLDINSKWKKISRFENENPRDLGITSSSVESLNAAIVKKNLKNKEPLELFQYIYDLGFFALKNICFQKGILTDSVNDWLGYAMVIANHLTVSRNQFFEYKYEVTKDNDDETKLTVVICPHEKPSCSCKFYHDCGMPCIHLLAVAIKFNLNWSDWIHPRYFVFNYRLHFKDCLNYPDFDQVIKTNDDVPVGITSLKQKQKRIKTPGE